ncbi:MAG: hypothetical protein PHI29_07680 [Gallionella sp.]|nr:hypothetical protein [Gallionella sp.]
MDKENILRDLKERTAGKTLLTAEDLAPIIHRSPQAQANLRNTGTFPLPIRKVGRVPMVSVYDLADWLAGECVQGLKPKTTATEKEIFAVRPNRKSLGSALGFMTAQTLFIAETVACVEKLMVSDALDGSGLKSPLKRI